MFETMKKLTRKRAAELLEVWNAGYAVGKQAGKLAGRNEIVRKLEAYKCTCLKDNNDECYCSSVRYVLDNIVDDGGSRE
jgi:hypothetical protein